MIINLKHLEVYGIAIEMNDFSMLMVLFADFSANNNNCASCKLKTKLANRTGIDGIKKVKNYGTFLIFNQLLENS